MEKRKSSCTEAEDSEFRRILGKIEKDGGYFRTTETLHAFNRFSSRWALEIVITRHLIKRQPEILLTIYSGGEETFKGRWHIPGGYYLDQDNSYEEVVWRKSEEEIGLRARAIDGIGLPYFWKRGEHPNGRPLSIFTFCQPIGLIKENEQLKFFPIFKLPDKMVAIHKRWLEKNGPLIVSKLEQAKNGCL